MTPLARLEPVSGETLISTLRAWVLQQNRETPKHLVGVRWPQLSIVFCKLRLAVREQPCATTMLLFLNECTDTYELVLDESAELREHLLFVNYEEQFRCLSIYGDMSLQQYGALAEFGFLTLADCQQASRPLVYALELDSKFLERAKLLANGFHTLSERFVAEPFGDGELDFELAYALFVQVAGLSEYRNRLHHQSAEELYNSLCERLLEPTSLKDARRRFRCAVLLSAMSSEFAREYIRYEQLLLELRFECCYTTERMRVALLEAWFPGLLETEELGVNEQFYAPPAHTLGHNDGHRYTDYRKCVDLRNLLAPQQAVPGILLRGPLRYATQLRSYFDLLRIEAGTVSFTHHVLCGYLQAYIEEFTQQQTAALKLHTHELALARQVWTRLMLRSSLLDWALPESAQRVREEMAAVKDTVRLERALELGQQLYVNPFAQQLVALLGSFDGYYGQAEYESAIREWPSSSAATAGAAALQFRRATVDEAEAMPSDFAALEQLAKASWPPCMQAMVEQCRDTHLRHLQRVAMSGLIRALGYSAEQGEQLWDTLFSETQVYAACGGTTEAFMKTDRGNAIVYDYSRNRQSNLGVSCLSLVKRGFCPVAARKGYSVGDIEDCQKLCTPPEFHFPINSPRNYFIQARRKNEQ